MVGCEGGVWERKGSLCQIYYALIPKFQNFSIYLATVGAMACPAFLPALFQCPWQLILSPTYRQPTVTLHTFLNEEEETHASLEF